jgi:putative flavoprotein involved in K+ transport
MGRRMQDRDTLIGSSPRKTGRAGVTLRPRAVSASGRTVWFEDDHELDVDAVVWATGFGLDHSWIDVPDGGLRHQRGVTDTPGLYFVGLPWQHTRGSALLGWVAEDAKFIAERIAERAPALAAT